jgi:hypothetical protein
MIKLLSPEVILSFKNRVDKSSKELDQLFESINSSFISSTNKNEKYKNIKFINHFKKSTNKWKKSIEDKGSVKLLVKNNVNKLSDNNFDKISEELIFNLKINNYESLIILANELFNSVIMHPVYINNYINLIKKIYYVTSDHWNYDGKSLIDLLIIMSQIKYFMDYRKLDEIEDSLDNTFTETVQFIELDGLDEKELKIVNKSMKISNIKFIVQMYLNKFLDSTIMDNIIVELINLETTHSIEALIEILNMCENNDKIINKNFTKLEKLKSSKEFDFRLNFIYGEALCKYDNKKSNSVKVKKLSPKQPVKKEDLFMIGCENIIEEYIMIEEFEEVYEYLKDSQDNYHDLCKFSDVLIRSILCSKEIDYTKLKSLVKQLMGKKILKPSNWKKGFNNNIKNFEDIMLDYPKANKNLSKFITYSKKSNIIKEDYINELITKYEVSL